MFLFENQDYYYSINQIDMCRNSLNQILRSKSQENHFKEEWFTHLLWKKEKLNKSNKIKYEISMINYKGCKLLSFTR